jgi:hypothetical protein
VKLRVTAKPDKMSRKELRYATKFMASKLMTKRMLKSLSIHVKDCKHNNFHGVCDQVDAKHYRIELNTKLSRGALIDTLAHELAHVKQYARKELSDVQRGNGIARWKQKRYSIKQLNDEYWLLPWEVEAHGYGICLSVLYKKHLSDNIVTF